MQDFGAFVELEPSVEGLAHVSTFPPTGTADGWKRTAPPGMTGQFEILSVDLERKRIGVALLDEGSSRAGAAVARASTDGESEAAAACSEPAAAQTDGASGGGARAAGRPSIVPGARLRGKVERHENYGVFIFLAPGRTGLMPLSESAVPRGTDLKKALPLGSEIEVVVLEAEPSGKRIRLSRKAILDTEEKDDVRAFSERRQAAPSGSSPGSFGSIGEKLRAALASKQK